MRAGVKDMKPRRCARTGRGEGGRLRRVAAVGRRGRALAAGPVGPPAHVACSAEDPDVNVDDVPEQDAVLDLPKNLDEAQLNAGVSSNTSMD